MMNLPVTGATLSRHGQGSGRLSWSRGHHQQRQQGQGMKNLAALMDLDATSKAWQHLGQRSEVQCPWERAIGTLGSWRYGKVKLASVT